LVVGGVDRSNSPTAFVETYYPGQSSCTRRLADSPTACTNPILCYINGKLFLGINSVRIKLYIYDPAANIWNDLGKDSMFDHPRQPFTCGDRSICVMDDDNPECFDTMNETWTRYNYIETLTGAESCVVETNNKLFVFGGTKSKLVQVMNLDLTAKTWTTVATMQGSTVMGGCRVLPGSGGKQVLVADYGTPGRPTTRIFNVETNLWEKTFNSAIDLSQADFIVSGLMQQIYAFGLTSNYYRGAYAFCPNNALLPWQIVPVGTPVTERYYSSTVVLPLSYFPNAFLANCSPTDFNCV